MRDGGPVLFIAGSPMNQAGLQSVMNTEDYSTHRLQH